MMDGDPGGDSGGYVILGTHTKAMLWLPTTEAGVGGEYRRVDNTYMYSIIIHHLFSALYTTKDALMRYL